MPKKAERKDTMKLIKEMTERFFSSFHEAKEFFSEQVKNDIWQRCSIQELEAVPVPGERCALLTPEYIRTDVEFDSEVSDESIIECLDGTKVSLRVPLANGYHCYPVSETGYMSLITRCGWGKNPPVMTCDSSKAHQNVMCSIDRALALNLGKKYFTNKVLVLIRDEKVRAVHSGDESDYSVLPMTDLLQVMETELEKMYNKHAFLYATASHNFSTVGFQLNDPALKNELRKIFAQANITLNSDPVVKLITSDTAVSGANIFILVRTSDTGNEMLIGTPLCLTHSNRHSVEDFRKNVQQITALFRDATEKISEMSTSSMKHPVGALRYIAVQKVGLPKKFVADACVEFEQTHYSATQLDVYMALYGILDAYVAEVDVSSNRMMQFQENIARTCFINMNEYDFEYEFK